MPLTTDNAPQPPPGVLHTRFSVHRCPACGSANVRRSTIRSREAGAHALRSPYRCRVCRERFWVLSRKARIYTVTGIVGVVLLGAFVWVVSPFDDDEVIPAPPGSEVIEVLKATPRDPAAKSGPAQKASPKADSTLSSPAAAPPTPAPQAPVVDTPPPPVVEQPLRPPAQPFVK